MKKSNPVNVIFKGKVHFDVQIPISGSLAAQVDEKTIFEQIKKAPSTNDVTISERLEKLKKFNKNNDDDDNDDDDMMETVPVLVYRLHLRLHQKIMISIVNLILTTKH